MPDTPDERFHSGHGSTPVPDPTLLTTAALTREIAALKEIVFTRLDGMDRAILLFNENLVRTPTEIDKQIQHLKELHETRIDGVVTNSGMITTVVETRLDAMDRAIKLAQDHSDRLPENVDEKISSLAGVHEEKFSSIQVQFRERDVRSEQSSKDSKVAVDAALQAAKEAVAEQNRSSALAIAKSEASTIKQIDQMGLLIQTGNKAVDDKFADVKERLVRLEGKGEGKTVADDVHRGQSNWVIGVAVAIVLGLLETGIALAVFLYGIKK